MLGKILEKIEFLIQLLTTIIELLDQLAVHRSNPQSTIVQPELPPSKYLSIKQAAQKYSFDEKTFRRWIEDGKIIPTTIGGRNYFDEYVLDEYIKSNGFADRKRRPQK